MPDIHCKKSPAILLINKAITLHIYLFLLFWVRTFKFDTKKKKKSQSATLGETKTGK